jgi:hypothetical protein
MSNLVLLTRASGETSYSVSHIRNLLSKKLVKGGKEGGIWLVDLDELKAYKKAMEELGSKKFDPTKNKNDVNVNQ